MSAISTISSLVRGGKVPKVAKGYITRLDGKKNDAVAESRSLQYFPETIQDIKNTNWQAKEIPGLSHPLYQWTAGGSREVSFTAIFTRDRALTGNERKEAESASGVLAEKEKDPYNVDIPSAVAWLRQFKYPEISASGGYGKSSRPYPPSKLILTLPGVRLNIGNNPHATANDMYAIMLSCEVTYEAFFSDGTPRIARVGLAFAEILQVQGRVQNHDAAPIRNAAVRGYTAVGDGSRRS